MYDRGFRMVFGYVGEIRIPPAAKCTVSWWAPYLFSCFVSGSFQLDSFGGPVSPLTPTQLQVICVIPWRYGGLGGEWGDIFVRARVVAFASRAAFLPPADLISIGGQVGKFPRPRIFTTPALIQSSGSSTRPLAMPLPLSWLPRGTFLLIGRMFHFSGWRRANLDEWRSSSFNTVPEPHWNFSP